MKRTQADIKRVIIDTQPPGINAWRVDILYTDGKAVHFQIDFMGDVDMLDLTVQSIKKQLAG